MGAWAADRIHNATGGFATMLMHRREFVRHAGFAALVGLGAVPGAFAAAAIKPRRAAAP